MEETISKKPLIVTHNGRFHADECFAVAALLLFLQKNISEVELIRSRKEEDWARGDYVIDVGGIYDPEKNRFDHHQQSGAGKREEIPYAAFGLVWKKFGESICRSKSLADKIDTDLVAAIDANDNGIEIYKPLYSHIYPYSFSSFVNTSNLTWKEDRGEEDQRFIETMLFLQTALQKKIKFLEAEEDAKQEVLRGYEEAEDKRIIILDKNYPWESVLSELPEPLIAVWPRSDGTYGVKTVRDDTSKFKNRRDLPEKWAGKTGEELQSITGVEDALFCHNARFMAGAKSKEGAVKLAKLALEN